MNKEKALERLTALEKETAELRKIIDTPDIPKLSAKEWLQDFISKPFDKVTVREGYITYCRDGQWVFQQDLKMGCLWCYYHKVWEVFENDYNMSYAQIQALHKAVVCEALNCKGLTPETFRKYNDHLLCTHLEP